MSEQDEIWERDDMIAALRARVDRAEHAAAIAEFNEKAALRYIATLETRVAKLEAQNKALRARLEELDNEAAGYGLWTLGT
jgi:plasmid stabilization system protein ParE